MEFPQTEADRLFSLDKAFVSNQTLLFSLAMPFEQTHDIISRDQRETFLLDLERGDKKRARLKFQTRAHKTIVLARIDIDGKPHRNPETSPHRPNERFTDVHIHIYREGFGDRIAYRPEDIPGFTAPNNKVDDVGWLLAFFDFCRILDRPDIQTEN